MPLTPRGLYHLTVLGEIHGQQTQNGFHFMTKNTSTETSYLSEAQALVANFEVGVLNRIKLFASDDWSVKSLLVTTLIPKTAVLYEKRIAVGSGTQGDDSLPSFCAGLLSLRTGGGGRSRNGRLYIPGVPEDAVSDSRIQGSNLTQLADIGAAILERYGIVGTFNKCVFGVYSRKLGVTRDPGPPPTLNYDAGGFAVVNEIVARNHVVTMRKRMLFRGV